MIVCRIRICLAFLALVCCLGRARTASAEPRLGGDRHDLVRQLAEEKQRLRAIEAHIRQIEAELARESRESHVIEQSDLATCALPFFLDRSGVKHLRSECMDDRNGGAVSCASPFLLKEDGLLRVRAECNPDMAPTSAPKLLP